MTTNTNGNFASSVLNSVSFIRRAHWVPFELRSGDFHIGQSSSHSLSPLPVCFSHAHVQRIRRGRDEVGQHGLRRDRNRWIALGVDHAVSPRCICWPSVSRSFACEARILCVSSESRRQPIRQSTHRCLRFISIRAGYLLRPSVLEVPDLRSFSFWQPVDSDYHVVTDRCSTESWTAW